MYIYIYIYIYNIYITKQYNVTNISNNYGYVEISDRNKQQS